jgi:hypothetical protein
VQKLARVVIFTLIYLVVFDLIGVVVCFFFDVASALPLRGNSTALFYAIWFVLGVFCGLLSYNTGTSFVAGFLVVMTTAVILTALSISCYVLLWRYDVETSFYVPDNAAPTLTFFVTVLASVVLAHKSLGPEPTKKH